MQYQHVLTYMFVHRVEDFTNVCVAVVLFVLVLAA